jgi:DnaJ-class molecular chaperone
MHDHYEKLGVDKAATPAEIKRAYRSKANQTHPDKGGSTAEFAPVVRAYEVLSDPAKRLLYDTTGEDKRPPIEKEVQDVLMQLFLQALSSPDEIEVVEWVSGAIKAGAAKIPEDRKKHEARKKQLEQRRKRIKSTGELNIPHLVIDGELKHINAQLANLDHLAEVNKACAKALKAYSEDAPPEPEPVEVPVGYTVIRFS